MQYQVRTGPITNAAATFGPEMVQGSRPDAAHDLRTTRFVFARREGLSVSQTTHVAATFQSNMSQGSAPERARPFLPLRVGLQAWVSDILLWSPDMSQGSKPDRPRPFTAPRFMQTETSPTHIAAAFSFEMGQGADIDRNREHLPLKTGWIANPTVTTHGAAAFSPEMAAGARADRFRELLPLRTGTAVRPADVDPFSPEMAQGSHPDSGRPFAAPRLALPFSTQTHVAAAVSPDMTVAYGPVRSREGFRVRIANGFVPDVLVFSPEMAQGWTPSSPRLFLAPRIPLQPSQVTPVEARFSVEMAAGAKPDTPPRLLRGKAGWSSSETTFVVAMTPDQFAGVMPSASRVRLGARIPLPLAQPTHVPAPFSAEMVQGAIGKKGVAFVRQPGHQVSILTIRSAVTAAVDFIVACFGSDSVRLFGDPFVQVDAESVVRTDTRDVTVLTPPADEVDPA